MDLANDIHKQELQFPSSIFNIHRQYMPALVQALHTPEQDEIAEQLAGSDYALYLILAVEAAQQRASELAEAAKRWSPPLYIDLSLCSIDCSAEHWSEGENLLVFWFYSEDGPKDWMEGYSEQFFDFTVKIDADRLTVHSVGGPSR